VCHYWKGSQTKEEGARREKAEEEVRCELGCSCMVQTYLRGRKRENEAWQRAQSTNMEDAEEVTICRMPTVPSEQRRRECNTTEHGHQGNYFTDSPKLGTGC